MKRLIVLGTGNAIATKCYNTCFALCDGNEYFLVDAGGGNGILSRFEAAGINWNDLHHVFVTHEHTDHLFGIFWVMRMAAMGIILDKFKGNLNIYCHTELTDTIKTICKLTLGPKENDLIGKRIILIPVQDGEQMTILDNKVTFFDIGSTKCKQYGFSMQLKNKKVLTCLGDEPCHPSSISYVKNSDWLLCEAFCLYAQREKYTPYKFHHVTVKDACETAEQLGVKNLVLWHTEDDNLNRRKELYTAEGKEYYGGNIFVPDDLETIEL